MLQPIQWAKHSTSGEQAEADGSRLLNFYAIRPASPTTDQKTPVILYGTPGLKTWLNLPAVPSPPTSLDAVDAVYAVRVIDSPSLGVFVVGITGQFHLFWKRLDTINSSGRYMPYLNDQADLARVFPSERAQFTGEDAERAQGPVQMADDGRYVMVVTKDTVKMLDLKAAAEGGTNKVLSQIQAPTPDDANATLPDEEWVGCAWVDGYFFLLSRAGQIFHSTLNTIEFDQLEFNYASSKPDEGVGLVAHERLLYVFGSRSVEIWRNIGALPFAFRRVDEKALEIGCAAAATIQALDIAGVFMLGSNGIVYLINNFKYVRMSTESVEADIAKSDLAKARAFSYIEQGHHFYSLTLDIGGAKKNWTLDVGTRLWHERTVTDVLAVANYENLTIAGRDGDRNLHEMALRWGTVDDAAVEREAVAPVMHASQRRATVSSLQLDIPQSDPVDRTKPAYATVPAHDERVKMAYSDDVGETWAAVGDPAGKQLTSVRHKWNRGGQFRGGRNYRIQISAVRPVTVLGAYAEVEHSTD